MSLVTCTSLHGLINACALQHMRTIRRLMVVRCPVCVLSAALRKTLACHALLVRQAPFQQASTGMKSTCLVGPCPDCIVAAIMTSCGLFEAGALLSATAAGSHSQAAPHEPA